MNPFRFIKSAFDDYVLNYIIKSANDDDLTKAINSNLVLREVDIHYSDGTIKRGKRWVDPSKDIHSQEHVTDMDSALKALSETLGFTKVPFNYVEHKGNEAKIVNTTNTLIDLEKRFNAIHFFQSPSLTVYDSTRLPVTYTDPSYKDITEAHLSLNNRFIKESVRETEKSVQSMIDRKYCMPCAKEHLKDYEIAIEYGNLVHRALFNRYLAKHPEYKDNIELGLLKCSEEMTADIFKIARELGAKINFKELPESIRNKLPKESDPPAKHINYHQSLFSEAFANSQCGNTIPLGKAVEIYLNKKLEEKI